MLISERVETNHTFILRPKVRLVNTYKRLFYAQSSHYRSRSKGARGQRNSTLPVPTELDSLYEQHASCFTSDVDANAPVRLIDTTLKAPWIGSAACSN